jgi:hypothetical protein
MPKRGDRTGSSFIPADADSVGNGHSISAQYATDRFAPIVLKKSFFAMIENSQDRWCVSLTAM